ncbi:sensor histidine kinase [Inhella gelatinilytica]|uniref:histidine kinase n=1 Tax=Inhella gelatinilytica TaxID=2795030 RepID=A0A931NEW7_9BURK|nr:ATP-binding protein [Inhella gelatinilytica]MBH9554134.1 ATP-binding protein [Inhella gelatinilytica]
MAFDGRTWVAAALLMAAGAACAQPSARWQVAGVALALGGMAALLARRPQTPPVPIQAAEPATGGQEPTALLRLQVLLEHLPAATWMWEGGGRLQALSARARRLMAPGGVRDAQALQALLVERARAGQGGQIQLDTERGGERWGLALQALSLAGQEQVLIVLLPLENELEAERQDAWRSLVQVLTHEIMNSLTPIASLSQSALGLLEEAEAGQVDAGPDLRLALDTVAQRAAGLQRFVLDYRRLSQVPPPQLEPVDVEALLRRLEVAVAPAWVARGGAVLFTLHQGGLRLQADPAQLEQALLNLIRNAEVATRDCAQPKLWVEAKLSRGGRLRLTVRDNGPGVPAGLEQQIFLPFFSAAPGGSGIGLTLTRQLVHGMGGRLRHVRPLEGGAAFVLSF